MADSGNQNTPENQALRGERYGGPLRVPMEVVQYIGEFADRVYRGKSDDFDGLYKAIEEAARQSKLEIDLNNSEWGEELPGRKRTHDSFCIAAQAHFLQVCDVNEYLNRWWEGEVLNIREQDRLQTADLSPETSAQNTDFSAKEKERRSTLKQRCLE